MSRGVLGLDVGHHMLIGSCQRDSSEGECDILCLLTLLFYCLGLIALY